VTLIEGGVLGDLLVGRTPAPGFTRSNGHGRGDFHRQVAGRQSNLVVQPSRAVPAGELLERLRAEARRQGKPYGLLVREADGIFTPPMNQRPVSFGVRLPRLERVYVDGRPNERVRGAQVGGASLALLSRIVAASDDYQVVNFGCFGDSGFLPMSASSPSLLFDELPVERSTHYRDRNP
jgi:predicted Zn-dependent protease